MSAATKVILTPGMSMVEVATHLATGAVDAETVEQFDKDEKKRVAKEAADEATEAAAGKLTVKVNPLGKHLEKDGKPRFLKVKDKATGVESDVPIIGKGNVQVNGFGRFPLTLYASQWKRLAGFLPTILKLIDDAPAGTLAEK